VLVLAPASLDPAALGELPDGALVGNAGRGAVLDTADAAALRLAGEQLRRLAWGAPLLNMVER
jgi:hypothetical protein